MDRFREVVNTCGFKDLGYCGPDFTWCNMQEGINRTYLRLDRALATNDWISYFSGTRVLHLVDSTFDHCALLIADSIAMQPSRKRRFHFEEMWTKKKECKDIIKNAWGGACIGALQIVSLQVFKAVQLSWRSGIRRCSVMSRSKFRAKGKPLMN